MSYSNLEKELKEYSDYNKQAIITISKLSQFFKSFGQQGKKFNFFDINIPQFLNYIFIFAFTIII